MGLGKLLTRNITYDVTNSLTGETASYTIVTDGGPGMYAGWGGSNYRGALGIPAAWRLSMMIANQLGRIPWHAFREVADRPAVKLPAQPFLTAPAGTRDTRLSVFRGWAMDRIWHGNAIGLVAARSPLGYPVACTPVSAEFVQVKLVTSNDPVVNFEPGEIAYLINGRWFHQRDVIHFKGPCKPGDLRGLGILEEHFDLMSRSRKLDASASAVDSGAVPTGLLRSLNPDMTATEAAELKTSWQASQATRSVAVLNPLTEFVPIAWNPTETQLLEARQYTLTEWSNVFGVPMSYAGAVNSSRVYSNVEDQGSELLKFGTVGDLIAEFEEVLTTQFPRGTYVKGNVDHLLRNDTKSRYEAHAIAISSGFLTRDEVRELEERPPLTAEQKAELEAMNAPAPAGNNTPGSGQARPRLAAVRALMGETVQELADDGGEIEPDYDGPGEDPGREWFPGEAEAWAADQDGGPIVATSSAVATRAADRTGRNLHQYWTKGAGLARWRGSATPWRTLREFLSKYLSGETLDATTSAWYMDVFGKPPGGKRRGGRGRRR